MRETVASWSARSGARYAPPEALLAHGRPLREDEPCPTLFRYPGACGLQGLLQDRPGEVLGPSWSGVLWLGDAPGHTDAKGAAHFGAVVFPEALRLQPVVSTGPWAPTTADGRAVAVYVAANAAVDPASYVWIPPSSFDRVDWDAVRTPSDVRDAIPDWEASRFQIARELSEYLEELDMMRRSGAPGPSGPWCDLPAEERRALMEQHGVRGIWTR
jgi:hypothetical protein